MKAEVRFHKAFEKAYARIKNSKERAKAADALDKFQNEGSSAPHFKYLTEIAKKLKAQGLFSAVLRRLLLPKQAALGVFYCEKIKRTAYIQH